MSSNQILMLTIIICLILSIILMFPKFFKFIGRILMNMVIGLFVIWIINKTIISPQNMNVGINFFTAGVTGILGLPGVAVLYVIQYIING